jgi:hypothetical protein
MHAMPYAMQLDPSSQRLYSKRVEHTTARGFLPEKKKKATMLRRTMDEAAFVGKMGIQSRMHLATTA